MAGSFAQTFSDWCNDTIIIEPYLGADDYGKPIYGGPVSNLPCYIEEKVKLVRDLQGEQKASTTTLYVIAGPFDPRDLITMPSNYKGPQQPSIISVSNVRDHNEFSHCEIYL